MISLPSQILCFVLFINIGAEYDPIVAFDSSFSLDPNPTTGETNSSAGWDNGDYNIISPEGRQHIPLQWNSGDAANAFEADSYSDWYSMVDTEGNNPVVPAIVYFIYFLNH